MIHATNAATMVRPWEIRHVDLSQDRPSLFPLSHAQGWHLVIWWQHIPLGDLTVPNELLPLSFDQVLYRLLPVITPTVGSHLLEYGFQAPLPGAYGYWSRDSAADFDALADIQHPLQRLIQQQSVAIATSQVTVSVSVVICTRDRPESLERCLRSLQTLRTQPHEIWVVDNAPSDDRTQTLVTQFPSVRYVSEPRPGLSIARNTGLRQATGDLIAFTDDDVEVHPHWIDHLCLAFQDPTVMAMTGLILPAKLETEAEQIFQLGSTGFGWGYRPLTFDHHFFEEMKPLAVPVWRIGAGANMAFRRSIFAQVGEFDERLGAGASGCSEDSEFWYRILAAGWSCRYEPTAVVYHYHRADLSSLSQQMRAYMRGHVAALLVQADLLHERGATHWGNLRRVAIALPRYYARQLLTACFYRFQGRYRTVLAEIQGCLAGISFYVRHPRNPQVRCQTIQNSAPDLTIHSQP